MVAKYPPYYFKLVKQVKLHYQFQCTNCIGVPTLPQNKIKKNRYKLILAVPYSLPLVNLRAYPWYEF